MKNEKGKGSGLLRRLARYCIYKVMSHELFLPVVNPQGDVTGRILAEDAFLPDNQQMLPMVRIAIAAHGLLYLRHRPQGLHFEAGKSDLPIEGYLMFGESLEHSVQRILHKSLPEAPVGKLFFNLPHLYCDTRIRRLVYLYTLDLGGDETLLKGQGGKLWSFPQIEHNLDKRFFSSIFEDEYETLKEIVSTREQFFR